MMRMEIVFVHHDKWKALLCSGLLVSAIAPVSLTCGSAALAQSVYVDPRNAPVSAQQAQQTQGPRDDGGQGQSARESQVEPASAFEPANISSASVQAVADEKSSNGKASGDIVPKRQPAEPNEFEKFVQQSTGKNIKRFGSELLTDPAIDFNVPATTAIPGDYPISIGDTISINLIGSVEGSANFTVDRNGEIFLPQVGKVKLVGVRNRDLRARISDAIGTQYRGFEVTVAIRKLHGIRVYVTGFAQQPGAFTVSSLSTLLNAVLAAGGPNSGGSFRSVKLYRSGREVTSFDLYDVLRGGDRSRDAILQNEDVIFIPPVGPQYAVVGSVNEEAIYEGKPGESLADALKTAGGPNGMAEPSRVLLYSLADKDTIGSREVLTAQLPAMPLTGGDVIQILSKGSLAFPLERQAVVVRLEGEVVKPGNYYVAPGTALTTVIEQAGGLTDRAYIYGTRLTRVSVRAQQQEQYREAIGQLENILASAPLKADQLISESDRNTQIAAARQVLERLQKQEPDGRLVLDVPYGTQSLPSNIILENNDRVMIPPRSDVIGVYGAVYRPAAFALGGNYNKVSDYIERAGGTMRSADRGDIIVIRASGEVLTRSKGALNAKVLPGDAVFVPVKTQSSSFWSRLRDISQIIFQLGLGAATVAAIK